MNREYTLASPSLEGVFQHESVSYAGLKRPLEVLRLLDGPSSKGVKPGYDAEGQRVLNEYFHDLYGIFMKKLSHFAVASESAPEEDIKLQAMLQEMIKIKKLICRSAL